MKQDKKVQVVMLTTEQAIKNTELYQIVLSNSLFWTTEIEKNRYTEGSGWLFLNNSLNSVAITIPNKGMKKCHLYITSDEEVKEGDYVFDTRDNFVLQFNSKRGLEIYHEKELNSFKKIIATTDKSLGFNEHFIDPLNNRANQRFTTLPQPSAEFIPYFIEEYNKGNIITEVLVEYEKESYEKRFTVTDTNGMRDTGRVWGHTYNLKINPDNTINIKPVEQSWDDVKELYYKDIEGCKSQSTFVDDFIKYLKNNYKLPKKL